RPSPDGEALTPDTNLEARQRGEGSPSSKDSLMPRATERRRGSERTRGDLLATHLAELRRSGLVDLQIERAGLYSELSSSKIAELLNWEGPARDFGAALVIPFTGADGEPTDYCRVKPDRPRTDHDGKTVKYESPKGQPNRPYFPPGFAKKWRDVTTDVLI